VRILVLGDRFCPASAFQPWFLPLEADHQVDYRDLIDEPDWRPETPSERGLREFLGTPQQVIDNLSDHDVLVIQGGPITDAVLDAAPLRLVCVARGGPVNVDVPAATARGIPVVTTPGKNVDAVADLALALVIMLARRLAGAIRYVDAGGECGVDNYEGANWMGHDLTGHTLGLIGFGQVGRRVATRAIAFGLDVLAHDPFVDPQTISAAGVSPTSLAECLSQADHVSVHARLTTENQGLFRAANFHQMRVGATFVNTARSELVVESDLVDALRSGHLSGAALDVASPQPAGERHPLLSCPNVIILPHLGGATAETLANAGRMAAAEIERFYEGKPLVNVANPGVPGRS
jgi:phosphoglycerate dehydrogenase-like enzyme